MLQPFFLKLFCATLFTCQFIYSKLVFCYLAHIASCVQCNGNFEKYIIMGCDMEAAFPLYIVYHCVSHNTGRCAAFLLYNTHCVSHNTGRATHDSMCGYRIWGAARHTIHHGSQKNTLFLVLNNTPCITKYTMYHKIHCVSHNTQDFTPHLHYTG